MWVIVSLPIGHRHWVSRRNIPYRRGQGAVRSAAAVGGGIPQGIENGQRRTEVPLVNVLRTTGNGEVVK